MKNLCQIIKDHSIAYQFADGLVEFTEPHSANAIDDIVQDRTSDIVSQLDMINQGWDLAEWSTNSDTLLFYNCGMLLCVPNTLLS